MNDNETSRPILIGMEETPELADAWRGFFSAVWDAYETLQERRRCNDQMQARRENLVTSTNSDNKAQTQKRP